MGVRRRSGGCHTRTWPALLVLDRGVSASKRVDAARLGGGLPAPILGPCSRSGSTELDGLARAARL